MNFRILTLFFVVITGLTFPELSSASVIFRPGQKAKYVPPGEEEINGDAEELFHIGQVAETEGNLKRAVRAYKSLVRHHPKDALAAGAVFRAAELQEQRQDLIAAAEMFRWLVEHYPSSPHFDEAIEGQFRIGEVYLAGKKLKVLGIPFGSSMDRAAEIFAAVVRTAPYGKYTARAQFDIGLAREKQGAGEAAIEAYQAVVTKFPKEPVAADAQYQIGYIWFAAARAGTKDAAATTNARTAFQDFLFRYPNSEKAPQARLNLQMLEHKQTASSYDVAKFYDKQKNDRAAVIYYNEVIRQSPGSTESEQAKKRIDQLRVKLGAAALEPAFAAAEAEKKKAGTHEGQTAKSESTMGKPPPNSGMPLPPPETDLSLPPPASLAPDTTTAPEPPGGSAEGETSERSSGPGASASAEATASPAP
jgi:outer membrane protein assembly factor BamD